jgi:hydroxymethylglutaryl-CoA reductase
LIEAGGGAVDVEVHLVDSPTGTMVVTHLLVDVRDAMGANAVNTMAEAVAPLIAQLTGGRVLLRILSNLADRRLVRARCVVRKGDIGGERVVDDIVIAGQFAKADRYRATTHNKGIMNGIIPVVLATGNDTRAIEAGAHAYAGRSGRNTALTGWEKNADGDLAGTIELPMAVGLVGGATRAHPVARASIRMLDVHTAAELAEIIACVGLAQNLGARPCDQRHPEPAHDLSCAHARRDCRRAARADRRRRRNHGPGTKHQLGASRRTFTEIAGVAP